MPIKKGQHIFLSSQTITAGGGEVTGASFDLRQRVRARILGKITNVGTPTSPAYLRVETAADDGAGSPSNWITFKRASARIGNNDVTPYTVPLDDSTEWARVVIEDPAGANVTALFDGSSISQIG